MIKDHIELLDKTLRKELKQLEAHLDNDLERIKTDLENRVTRLEGTINSLCPILKLVGDQLMIIADYMEEQ